VHDDASVREYVVFGPLPAQQVLLDHIHDICELYSCSVESLEE
jgi:hypothetical protein